MPITMDQRLERRKYLCASDTPVILGVSPYTKTARDIYMSKVYDTPQRDETDYLETGNMLEDPLLDWAAKELGGVTLNRQPWFVCGEGPGAGVFAAHPDAVIVGTSDGVEAKYANAEMAQEYGDQGTDEVPFHVTVQAQHQMFAGRLERIWVPVAKAGYSLTFSLYCVPRNDDLIGEIVTQGLDWWNQHIVAKVSPDGDETPPIEWLKRRSRSSELVIDLPEEALELVFKYEQAKLRRKDDDGDAEEFYAKILACLGTAESGRLPDGRIVTYRSQNSAPTCNYTMLRAQHPDIYRQYVTQGNHRVLRIAQAKKDKGAGYQERVA
jgi:putative phage-type endonuclease